MALAILVALLALSAVAAGADADAAAAPAAAAVNVMAQGLPLPKNTLTCTPWSWALCEQIKPNVYEVAASATGGGGMQAPQSYIHGFFSMDMKLPVGYSGGTNFAWYTMDTISPSNKDPKHSEIDFEFYGNESSKDAMLALNVFAGGKQNLAQYKLPFDPSAAMHTYSFTWNANQIVWFVDGIPMRVLDRVAGQPWPMTAMKPMASVWTTPWTKLQPDFTKGNVKALYGNYKAAGCLALPAAVQKPGPMQCPGPWNNKLTPAQMLAYQKFKAQTLLVQYGWDKA